MEKSPPSAKFKKLISMKVKFAMSSLIATIADFGIYLTLVNNVFNPVISNLISSGTGLLINLAFKRNSMFVLRRKYKKAILMGFYFSIIGLLLGTGLIYILNLATFFAERQYLAKLIVMAFVFFYNFYFKRFAFEKRMI